jgi:hypothetical protein
MVCAGDMLNDYRVASSGMFANQAGYSNMQISREATLEPRSVIELERALPAIPLSAQK